MWELVSETKRILQAAIELGGTTLRDYVGAARKPGYFIQSLNAYGREGKPCRVCGGPKKIILSQRSTVFCGTCQVSSAGLKSIVTSQIAGNGRMHEL